MSLEDRIKYAEMKARHARDLRPWYKKWWGRTIIIIGILLLIFLTICAFYVVNKVKEIKNQANQQSLDSQRALYLEAIGGDQNNYYLGTGTPKLTIIEFSDFACPYCQQSAAGVRAIAEQYKDKIKIIFRDYPLHDNSINLALAARCAGAQGKFWEMHDKLFANQNNLSVTGDEFTAKLISLAEDININTDEFSTCLTNKTYLDQVKHDYDDGETLQIKGTPTWFVNNYPLTGYMPEESFKELIGGLLNE